MQNSEDGSAATNMTVEYGINGFMEVPVEKKHSLEQYNGALIDVNLRHDDGHVGLITESTSNEVKHQEYRRMHGLAPLNENDLRIGDRNGAEKYPVIMTYRSKGYHPLPPHAIRAINDGRAPSFQYECRFKRRKLVLKPDGNTVAERMREYDSIEDRRLNAEDGANGTTRDGSSGSQVMGNFPVNFRSNNNVLPISSNIIANTVKK